MKIKDYHEMSLMVVNVAYVNLPQGAPLTVVAELRNVTNNTNQMMYHCIDTRGEHHFISRREVELYDLCFTEKGLYIVASSMIQFSSRLDREVVCYRFTVGDNGVVTTIKEFQPLQYLLGGKENEEN